MDDVFETFDVLLKTHLQQLVECIQYVAQARSTASLGKTTPPHHIVDQDVVKAALTIAPFPGKKDFVSEEYAEAVFEVLDLHRPKDLSDVELNIDTDNFSPFGSTEIDSDYSPL